MKKNFTGITTCILAAVCVIACHKDHNTVNNNLSKLDMTFITQASYANNDEVAAGQVATAKASDTAVKSFGAFMVTEHTTAQNDLKMLAANWNINVSATPDSMHILLMQKMQMLSGHMFDTAYIKSQVNDHNNAIALFQQEVNDGENTNLVNYAVKYLPHIIEHKQMADSIWNRIK